MSFNFLDNTKSNIPVPFDDPNEVKRKGRAAIFLNEEDKKPINFLNNLEEVKQEQTSRGWLVDLIYSIGENINLVDHLTQRQRKLQHQSETDESLEVKENLKVELESLEDLIFKCNQNRRNKMTCLFNNAPTPNSSSWCEVKHAISDWAKSYEVYLAQRTDETYQIAVASFDVMGEIIAKATGYPVEDCGACFFDMVGGKQ